MNSYKALELANYYGSFLLPHTRYIYITGSLRMAKTHVNTINILVEENTLPTIGIYGDLINSDIRNKDLAIGLKRIKQFGVKNENLNPRYFLPYGSPSNDCEIGCFLPEGIRLIIRIAPKGGFFERLAYYSCDLLYKIKMVEHYRKKGFIYVHKCGLRLQEECEFNNEGNFMHFKTTNPTLPPDFKNEEEYFQWLGMNYMEPRYRL